MKRRHFLSLTVPAIVLAGACGQKPFSFVQMADTQLGMIDAGNDGNNLDPEIHILEDVVSRINAMTPRPAFVTVCGDMTNLPGHKQQIAMYKKLMGKLDPSIALYNVSGNHDFSGSPSAENIAFYRDTYGPDWYSFSHGTARFIVLNSTLMKFPDTAQNAANEQHAWLETELADAQRSATGGTVVFMHHPFFDNSIDEEEGYHNIPIPSRREYLELFDSTGVDAVFSGHRHTTIPERGYKNVRLINTNAICNSFDNKPALRVVTMGEHGLSETNHLRDSIPEHITYGQE